MVDNMQHATPYSSWPDQACAVDDVIAVTKLQSCMHKCGGKTRVLALEDDPLQLRILVQHLESLELEVVSATCIEQAKAKLRDTDFQLAIFDVQLPDGSGFDLCELLYDPPHGDAESSGLDRNAGLPVIILSSLSASSVVRQTRAAGGYFFLCKPYDPNVLLALIERALSQCI